MRANSARISISRCHSNLQFLMEIRKTASAGQHRQQAQHGDDFRGTAVDQHQMAVVDAIFLAARRRPQTCMMGRMIHPCATRDHVTDPRWGRRTAPVVVTRGSVSVCMMMRWSMFPVWLRMVVATSITMAGASQCGYGRQCDGQRDQKVGDRLHPVFPHGRVAL